MHAGHKEGIHLDASIQEQLSCRSSSFFYFFLCQYGIGFRHCLMSIAWASAHYSTRAQVLGGSASSQLARMSSKFCAQVGNQLQAWSLGCADYGKHCTNMHADKLRWRTSVLCPFLHLRICYQLTSPRGTVNDDSSTVIVDMRICGLRALVSALLQLTSVVQAPQCLVQFVPFPALDTKVRTVDGGCSCNLWYHGARAGSTCACFTFLFLLMFTF